MSTHSELPPEQALQGAVDAQMSRIAAMIEAGEFEGARRQISGFAEAYGWDYAQLRLLNMLAMYHARTSDELILKGGEELRQSRDYRYVMEHGTWEQKQFFADFDERRRILLQQIEDEALAVVVRKAHVDGDYTEVIRQFKKIKERPSFTRWEEVEGYYQIALQREAHQRILEEYRSTIGDGQKYFLNKLRDNYPDEYKLFRKGFQKNTHIWQLFTLAVFLLCAAAIWGTFVNRVQFWKVLEVAGCVSLVYSVLHRYFVAKTGSFIGAIFRTAGTFVFYPGLIAGAIWAMDYFRQQEDHLAMILAWTRENICGELDTLGTVLALLFAIKVCVTAMEAFLRYFKRLGKVISISVHNARVRRLRKEWIPEFEKKEYAYLENRFKAEVGEAWVEPKSVLE